MRDLDDEYDDLDSLYDEPKENVFDKWNKLWINQPLLGTGASEDIGRRNQATFGTLDESLIDRSLFPGAGRVANLARDYGLSTQQALAGTAEGFSTPLNLATMAAGVGGYKTAGTALSKPLTWVERALSAPVAVTGAHKVTDPNATTSERLFGVAELAGGIAGTAQPFHTPRPGTLGGKIHGFDTPAPVDPTWTGFGPKPQQNIDLPLNFGPDAYAGPERRQTGARTPQSDTLFQDYRDRFARGEDVRSPQSQELFKKQQDTNAFREQAEQTYTQPAEEIGDIITMDNGVRYEYLGVDERGKPRLARIPDDEVLESRPVTEEQVVEEMPPQQPQAPELPSVRTATEQAPVFNNEAQVRQHFGERLAAVRTRYGSNSPQYGKLEIEFKSALENAKRNQGDLFGMSQMSKDVPPDRMQIDPNSMEVVQGEPTVNASGESAASAEAISRRRGMAARGEKFVVYDKAGTRREIIGPEAVDFHPAQGETYGIEYNDGRFSPLTHRGGKVPAQDFRTSLKDFIASTKKLARGEEGAFKYGEEEGPVIKRLMDWIEGKKSTPEATRPQILNPPDLTSPIESLSNEQLQRLSTLSPAEGGTGARATAADVELYKRGIGGGAKTVNNPTFYNANTGEMIDYDFDAGTRQSTRLEPGPSELPAPKNAGFIDPYAPSEMAKGKTAGTIGMGMTPDPVQMMKSYLNTYAEAGGRVATKELVQNAIDAAEDTGGEVGVTLDHAGKTVTVTDTGPGLTRHLIENEYTNLTESGKRGGPNKKIGEMGVGKTTYLIGSENFHVKTLVREADGKLWIHEFKGVPEDMYKGTVKVDSNLAPDQTLPTGTQVTIGMKDDKQVAASHAFLKQFNRFSNTPVKIHIESLEYPSFYDRATKQARAGYETQHAYSNLAGTLMPRNFGGGKLIDSGTVTGGDYRLSVPPNITYAETNTIALVLMNRGMFQGIDQIHVSKGELPEAILVEIDPTVDALSPDYPLTAPTRERLKDSFRQPLERIINKEVVEKAAAARKQRIQDAYDSLKPAPGVSFVALDSGGRYTPKELAAFNSNPHIQSLGGMMGHILQELDALHPGNKQLGKTAKFGFLLSDPEKGGINIPNPAAPHSASEFAILVNPFSAMTDYPPKQAARRLVHIIKHEFTHNKARNEGSGFTWALAETDSLYPIESEANAANRFFQIITDQTGNYAPEVQRLLQQHTAARGRPDSTPDLLSEARASEWAQGPKQGGISGGARPTGGGIQASNIKPTGGRTTPPIAPPQIQQARAQLYQLQNAHRMAPPGPVKESLYARIRDFNRTLLTGLDVSGAGRQGLPLIAEPEYWKSLDDMFKSLGSQGYYDNLHQMVQSAPWSQKRYVPVLTKGGQRVISKITQTAKLKELPSFYEEWGVDFARHEESQGSKAAERWIPGIKASNRAYNGFLTKLRFDTFNRMAQDLLNSGVDITKDIQVGKDLAEFVNNSTGRGSLGKLEKIAPVLNEAFFAPKLMAAKIRRYAQVFNPYTYHTMNPMIRRAAMKSLLSTAAFGVAFGELFRQMGADVSNDPTNSDFRKVRIGKLRIDPFGGDQQYLVAGVRLLSGQYTSPKRPNRTYNSGNVNEYFENMGSTLGNFTLNKLAPIPAFAWQLFSGESRKGGKFSIPEGVMNSTIPLVIQDIAEIVKEDPNLLPLGVLPVLGFGTQTFGKR